GIGSAMIGAMFVSLVYAIVSLIIWKTGYKWLMKLLPPIVVGPVIIVIGLALSGTAVDMAMNIPTADGGSEYSLLHFSAALVTLA
ncbi:solute carrier family 23 protein, partial [Streptococcus pneumoniae]|nr:solute carrier family 23 protein [Streptococcus pneumoniae]